MTRYRKRETVAAVQWTGDKEAVEAVIGKQASEYLSFAYKGVARLFDPSIGEFLSVMEKDWILQYPDGSFRVMYPGDFAEEYEVAE